MANAPIALDEAKRLILLGGTENLRRAGDALEKLLATDDGDAAQLDELSALLLETGRFESARRAADRWVKREATVASLIRLGTCLRETAKYEEASRCFQRALSRDKENVEALCGGGACLISAGYVVEGLMTVSQALHLDENCAAAHRTLAVGLLRQGSTAQAESAALEALRLAPDSAENIAALGLARMQQARLEEAERELRRAVELKPLYAEGWANLGFLLHRMGRLKEAATTLQRSLEIKPFKAATCNSLSAVLRSLGRWEEACEALQRACALAPRSPDYLTNLGVVYSEMDRFDDALNAMREALRIAPDHLPARANLPMLLTLAGRLDMALAEARELVKRNPEFAGGHHNLAAICNKLDLLDEAEAEAQRAVELAPQIQKHHLALAEILKRLGKLDKALGAARTALAMEENANVRFRLGMILRERGESAEAIKNFRRSLELDPEDSEGAAMFLAALEGKASPAAAPQAYIRRVFDSYAARFDDHLVKGLHYHGPQRYLEALLPHLPRREGLSILDLGCGTGLCGEVLRPLAGRLEGVDLSKRMIEQAERTGRYDALETADAVEGLQKRSNMDVIVAGDLFIYFGDLAPVLKAAARALAPGGLLAGNVEAMEEGTWRVNPSGRFSHTEAYVRQTAHEAGFSVLSLETAFLREEEKQPVPGYLMVLQADK
ncbi:MAG: hypothetical protein PWQ57_2671 [Desulfovibrionales bacterium]|nr:hypothetical protein [Desulfovibrionales bacterium]